jgi:uroporphyrinogen-III synthase
MTPDRPLAEVGVLVTRPAAQAEGFMARLGELGADVVCFPALAILPTARPADLARVLADLPACDLALFISPTAAEWGLAAAGTWPEAVRVAAVGQGTAQALKQRGIPSVLTPSQGADSEHLLGLPELADVAGQRVVLFRGEGGRELLADTLRARGARVDYAECYRRGRPEVDPAPLLAALAQGRLRALTAFSGETLDNLLAMLGPDVPPALFRLPLFAPHPRIAEHGRRLGFRECVETGPGEAGLIAGLVEYFGHVRTA